MHFNWDRSYKIEIDPPFVLRWATQLPSITSTLHVNGDSHEEKFFLHREWGGSTEYSTQWSGNGMVTFWRTFHHGWKIRRRCTPTSCHYISTIPYKVVVYSPAQRADTLPLFLLYHYMYSVGGTIILSFVQSGDNWTLFSDTCWDIWRYREFSFCWTCLIILKNHPSWYFITLYSSVGKNSSDRLLLTAINKLFAL